MPDGGYVYCVYYPFIFSTSHAVLKIGLFHSGIPQFYFSWRLFSPFTCLDQLPGTEKYLMDYRYK